MNDRKTAGKVRILRPQPHGGALSINGNPGNKGGGRHKAYMEQRAAELASDPKVWDEQLKRAQAGDLKPLQFAAERAFGATPHAAAAQIETPEGFKFTLILGERAGD